MLQLISLGRLPCGKRQVNHLIIITVQVRNASYKWLYSKWLYMGGSYSINGVISLTQKTGIFIANLRYPAKK